MHSKVYNWNLNVRCFSKKIDEFLQGKQLSFILIRIKFESIWHKKQKIMNLVKKSGQSFNEMKTFNFIENDVFQ